ncbi:hypothetical protein EDB86DRAFT_3150678 [Lactarius hatsudake]|nr:hypothetical protein EDB86DRAFT_3150678 [Lactarius hatsudake]
MGISLEKAELLSLGLTTFLYGLFFTLFFISTAVMSYRVAEDVRSQRDKILPVSFSMLVVATIHIILLWVRGKIGFIDQRGGSPTAFYENIADITNVLKVGCLLFQSLLGDGVIIWRLYVVYGKRAWVTAPSIILVIAYTVVGCVTLQFIAHARPGTDVFHVATSWITAYFSLTMVTNVLCSGAIAWRIFLAGKPVRGAGTKMLWPVIFIVIESSALYAFGVIAVLASFLSGSNGQYPAVDAIVPLVVSRTPSSCHARKSTHTVTREISQGIVFSLIVLQIRFHVSSPRSDGQTSTNGGVWPRPPGRPLGSDDPEYPMRSIRMAVHVTKQTHTHTSTHDVSGDSSSDEGTEKPTAF